MEIYTYIYSILYSYAHAHAECWMLLCTIGVAGLAGSPVPSFDGNVDGLDVELWLYSITYECARFVRRPARRRYLEFCIHSHGLECSHSYLISELHIFHFVLLLEIDACSFWCSTIIQRSIIHWRLAHRAGWMIGRQFFFLPIPRFFEIHSDGWAETVQRSAIVHKIIWKFCE